MQPSATVAHAVLTERYEALRARVLARSTGGDRYGLALLLREGMAAWIAAWSSCSCPLSVAAAPMLSVTDLAPPIAEPTAIVALLASMALSSLQEHRS